MIKLKPQDVQETLDFITSSFVRTLNNTSHTSAFIQHSYNESIANIAGIALLLNNALVDQKLTAYLDESRNYLTKLHQEYIQNLKSVPYSAFLSLPVETGAVAPLPVLASEEIGQGAICEHCNGDGFYYVDTNPLQDAIQQCSCEAGLSLIFHLLPFSPTSTSVFVDDDFPLSPLTVNSDFKDLKKGQGVNQ
jgi:hypothetical protein